MRQPFAADRIFRGCLQFNLRFLLVRALLRTNILCPNGDWGLLCIFLSELVHDLSQVGFFGSYRVVVQGTYEYILYVQYCILYERLYSSRQVHTKLPVGSTVYTTDSLGTDTVRSKGLRNRQIGHRNLESLYWVHILALFLNRKNSCGHGYMDNKK